MGAGDLMVFIIAEVASTTNGSFQMAKEMILEADHIGADAVKFQCLESSVRNSWAPRLKEIADDVGVEIMVTPFDRKAVDAWDPYVKRWKIASAELVNEELLTRVAETHKPLVISTGMSHESDVQDAEKIIKDAGHGGDRWWLHCVSSYPATPEQANIRAMWRLPWDPFGLSDHSVGTHIAIAAVGCGASVIEKHLRPSDENFDRANVTIDRSHPDHGDFALYPDEFAYMVRCIRDVEKALGDGIKRPMPGEALEARGRRLESV